jgi:spermidine dehydrogenase
MGRASNTGEVYDLVVVGAGFAGCTAAMTYHEQNPKASILILDNHNIFGGEAKQNEFKVDGYRLWGPQGSNGNPWPPRAAKDAGFYGPMWDQLGLPGELEWQEATGSDLKIAKDVYTPMHLAWEEADLGWFVEGHGLVSNPWANRFEGIPLPDDLKQDFIWMETYRQPPERKDWAEWLDSMTYKDFLINEMGIESDVHTYLNPFAAAMGCGLGTDVISAYSAFNFLQPGVIAYMRQMGIGDPTDTIYLASFPGGNTGILRHIVKRIIPGAFGDASTLTEIISNPVNWSVLDRADQPVRMRLSSLVVNVRHDGSPEAARQVNVTYLKDGEMRRITAGRVIMTGQQHMNKRVVTDLPPEHREAMESFMHAPIMTVNVALRNWKFMDKLGVSAVRWFEGFGWFTALRRQMILDSREPMPLDPSKPTVLTMYNSFCLPGIPVERQTVAARMQMFAMSFADVERGVREQFTRMFAAGGFDADRDIAGIVANRWGHAYVVQPPGFYFGKDGQPAPSDVLRKPHGRISFGHSELAGAQMWETAVMEGERAAQQALAI